MKKNIIVISHLDVWSMGKNKGAQSLWLTLKGYADANFNTFFITSARREEVQEVQYPRLTIKRFNVSYIQNFFKFKKVGFFFKFVFWIYFQIKAFLISSKVIRNKESFIFYGYEIYGVPVAKILSFINKRPLISRFQGTILMPLTKKKFWRIKYWQHVLAMKIHSDLIIMTNDGTQGDQILQMVNSSNINIEFLTNGVEADSRINDLDLDSIKEKFAINKEHRILLTVSRLVNWKRLDRIINSLPFMLEENKNITLIIVGDGREKENLIDLVKKLQLDDNVKFVGSVPHDELYELYGIADIFISLYDLSNVGNPLLEALSYGMCVVTLNNGDTGKFIQNGENGILLGLNEISNLPVILISLLNDNAKISSLGKSAKLSAHRNLWSWDQRIEYEIRKVNQVIEKYANN